MKRKKNSTKMESHIVPRTRPPSQAKSLKVKPFSERLKIARHIKHYEDTIDFLPIP